MILMCTVLVRVNRAERLAALWNVRLDVGRGGLNDHDQITSCRWSCAGDYQRSFKVTHVDTLWFSSTCKFCGKSEVRSEGYFDICPSCIRCDRCGQSVSTQLIPIKVCRCLNCLNRWVIDENGNKREEEYPHSKEDK